MPLYKIKKALQLFEDPMYYKKGLIGVFALCSLYWGWLIVGSSMSIVYDAVGYETLGTLIYEKGWVEFFSTGPHREPFYPFLISISMKLASIFSIDYTFFQKVIQVLLLFSTQLVMLKFFNEIKIHNSIKLLVILYFGFSPAVVNAAFSLFSEVATFPFVIGFVLLSYYAYREIHVGKMTEVLFLAVLSAISIIIATFVKAILQYVFLVFLIPFVCVAIHNFAVKNRRVFINSVAFVIVLVFTFGSAVTLFRYGYKKYSGSFEFTDRYDRILYGNAAKRVKKYDGEMILAHIAAIPGDGFCRRFFTKKQCDRCGFPYGDHLSANMGQTLLRDVPEEKIQITRIGLAMYKVFDRPFQYSLLTVFESFKMAFWESSNIGFVRYPMILQKVFQSGVFKNGIRLVLSLLTYAGLFYCFVFVCRNIYKLETFETTLDQRVQAAFLVLFIIIPFTALYSLFSILTRFAFPIISLYLICIAIFLNNTLFKESN